MSVELNGTSLKIGSQTMLTSSDFRIPTGQVKTYSPTTANATELTVSNGFTEGFYLDMGILKHCWGKAVCNWTGTNRTSSGRITVGLPMVGGQPLFSNNGVQSVQITAVQSGLNNESITVVGKGFSNAAFFFRAYPLQGTVGSGDVLTVNWFVVGT
jgi:hypothetical protein